MLFAIGLRANVEQNESSFRLGSPCSAKYYLQVFPINALHASFIEMPNLLHPFLKVVKLHSGLILICLSSEGPTEGFIMQLYTTGNVRYSNAS